MVKSTVLTGTTTGSRCLGSTPHDRKESFVATNSPLTVHVEAMHFEACLLKSVALQRHAESVIEHAV